MYYTRADNQEGGRPATCRRRRVVVLIEFYLFFSLVEC